MFPPYMVDIDLINSWMDQETEFLIDKDRLYIHVDPSKKVEVPTNSWLPNPVPTDVPRMNNNDDGTSIFTDLRDQPIESDSDNEFERNDILTEEELQSFYAPSELYPASQRELSSIISTRYSEVPRSEVTDRNGDQYDIQSAFTELSIHGSNTITGPVQANQDERNQESF